jgi:hypothetical protein
LYLETHGSDYNRHQEDTMATATVTKSWTAAIEVLRSQSASTRGVLHRNLAGITHTESLQSPEPGGNCLNWVVGHLDWVNEQILVLLGQPVVLGEAALARYQRGTRELHDTAEAQPLEKLLSAWDEQWSRIDVGLAALPPEKLAAQQPQRDRRLAACDAPLPPGLPRRPNRIAAPRAGQGRRDQVSQAGSHAERAAGIA